MGPTSLKLYLNTWDLTKPYYQGRRGSMAPLQQGRRLWAAGSVVGRRPNDRLGTNHIGSKVHWEMHETAKTFRERESASSLPQERVALHAEVVSTIAVMVQR